MGSWPSTIYTPASPIILPITHEKIVVCSLLVPSDFAIFRASLQLKHKHFALGSFLMHSCKNNFISPQTTGGRPGEHQI